jgi:hypothetical protein
VAAFSGINIAALIAFALAFAAGATGGFLGTRNTARLPELSAIKVFREFELVLLPFALVLWPFCWYMDLPFWGILSICGIAICGIFIGCRMNAP